MASRNRRVLFVTQTHNVWGGMEQWLHHFSLWLAEREWDVVAVLPRGARYNDPAEYRAVHPHLRSEILDARGSSERTRTLKLARHIDRLAPGIVIPIGTGAVFGAVASARAAGCQARLVVPVRSLHANLFCNIRDHMDVVDQVVGVSRLIEAVLRRMLPGASSRLHYVRHGARPPVRPSMPGSGPLRIGFVGRLEESTKRVSDVPRLARELRRRGIEAEIHVWGDGPDGELLRGERESGIVMHGAASQNLLYESAYPHLDVLVLFSPAEGSPNAVYEAMQHGVVPVIARYLGQSMEGFVRTAETGFVFPVGEISSAADAIARLASERPVLSAMSERVRLTAAGDTDERMHRDWERILESALALPPRTRVPPPLPPPSRLEKWLSPAVADRLRFLTGRAVAGPDGWSEWPGTAPASAGCVAAVEQLLRELDVAQ